MTTQTQTIRRVEPERVHDYLYDKHYTVSSDRDHARATFRAHTNSDKVKRVGNFETMFSELRHHPRFHMRLDPTDPVPKFINRQWRGYNEQAREALVRYKQFNYDPSVKVPPKNYSGNSYSVEDHYKFFHRPIIPFMQQVPPNIFFSNARQDPLAAGMGKHAGRPSTPLTRTVHVQTDYRDSEAQTDPYTPEYVIRPGMQPELLTLASLSYGRGLPAGLAEVEMIERARAKRAWEATLPLLNDLSQIDKRRRMMDEMERKEWALREHEIEKLQEVRLEVLKELLKQREEKNQTLNTKRLDRLWAGKQQDKEERVSKIRNEHIKTIRKLTAKRRNVEGKLNRPNIVSNYSDYASGVYAPMTRIGVYLDRGSEQYVVKSHYLSTYEGLLELENSLPDFVTAPRVKAPKKKGLTQSGFVKRKYRGEQELAEIHDMIKMNQNRVEEPPKPLRFLQKIEKPIPRPPTPTIDVPPQIEENRELAIIFLQQVIRGRAIQNMMFEGKEKRIELIRELRSTHALQEAEREVKRQEKQATLALQRQRRLHDHKESFIDEAVSRLESESLGDTLDFLAKELIRLQEERRIHAFAMLAERQRRLREAEESGRRQLEQRRRREEDEIFKQVLSVNQKTVDAYLQDVILTSMDHTADEQARAEIDMTATVINEVAYEMEDGRTQLQSEEIVSELVHGFLLPEVEKMSMRENVHRQQRKYLLAAHKEINGDGEIVIAMNPKADPPSSPPSETDFLETEEPAAKSPSPQPPTSEQVTSQVSKLSELSSKSHQAGIRVEAKAPLSHRDRAAVVESAPNSRPTSAQGDSTPRPSSRPNSASRSLSRSVTPSAKPPPSPATSRPTSGKPARQGSARDSPKPGSARESPKPGSARESPKPGSARESPKPGSARESPKPGSARESPKPGSARESPKPGSARESPKPGSARESPKPGSTRESPKPGSARDSPKPGSARESPKPGSARDSPMPGSARESPKPGSARKSPKPGSARESPKPGSSMESPKPLSVRGSPIPGSGRESPEPGSARESPKPLSVRGSPVPSSVRESSKSGSARESPMLASARASPMLVSARESPKPGAVRESPMLGSARASPMLGSARESPKPGAVRESPIAGSARASPKPGSARASPKPSSARESPKPGSARESPMLGSARESPKPGAVRESPIAGSARASPKPHSARESPMPNVTVQETSRPPSRETRSRPSSTRPDSQTQ